jgi:drug/metabolite transporter (DMT)-like permease
MPDRGALEPWVVLTLFAALLFAVGNALQTQGARRHLPPLSAGAFLTGLPRVFGLLLRSPSWLLGLLVTLIAVAVEIQALALGDVSVVKPLSRVQSLFVLGIGVALLGERLARVEWLGVAVMFAAAAWLAGEPPDAATFAPAAATSASIAIGIAALVTASLVVTDRGARWRRREHMPALAAGALFGLGDVLMKAATESVRGRTGAFDMASTGTLASLAGAAELPLSLLGTTLAFGLQQLAFSRGRVSLVVPLIGAAGTVTVVILGAALLREPFSGSRAMGIGAMLAGAFLIARAEGRDGAATSNTGRPAS